MRLPKLLHRYEEPEGWELSEAPTYPGRAARGFDKAVNFIIVCVIVLAFAYSSLALADAWGVLNKASSVQAKLMELKPTEASLAEQFAELQKINPDVCAWVEVDNTNISYPVVKGEKDFTYLDTDVYGEFSPSGSIFLSSTSNRDFTDNYSILHGHHMQGDVMFGPIDKFLDEAFFNENVTARIYLPDRILELESVAIVDTDSRDYDMYTCPSPDMKRTIDRVYEKALFTHGDKLTVDDQVISMATCATGGTNDRSILVFRVVDEKAPLKVGDEE